MPSPQEDSQFSAVTEEDMEALRMLGSSLTICPDDVPRIETAIGKMRDVRQQHLRSLLREKVAPREGS